MNDEEFKPGWLSLVAARKDSKEWKVIFLPVSSRSSRLLGICFG
jgi:hypothetical protein